MSLRTHETAVRVRQGRHLPRKRCHEKRNRRSNWSGKVAILIEHEVVLARECPEALSWIMLSLREMLNAVGIKRKASPDEVVTCFQQFDCHMFSTITPGARLCAHDVKKWQWCTNKMNEVVMLCAELVFYSGSRLRIIGSSADFVTYS